MCYQVDNMLSDNILASTNIFIFQVVIHNLQYKVKQATCCDLNKPSIRLHMHLFFQNFGIH